MKVEDRLAHLLPHWIEHNESHAKQFEEWAEQARADGRGEVAELIEAAARSVKQANAELAAAMGLLSKG
jgi:hypothetical protein